MSGKRDANAQLFDAFIKSAQYIVRLKSQQDVWDHLAKLVVTHFPATWIAFARRDGVQGICLHHSTLPDELAGGQILGEEVRSVIGEVLDSGFLASHVIAVPVPSMTALLPIVERYHAKEVMLIGHQDADPLPKELLNVYLAVAGLAGTAFERLHSEQELNQHRANLEDLVQERTAELAHAKRQNELILNAVREGICGVDLDGKITFVNPFAAKLIGWEAAELIGRSAHDTFHHARPDGCSYPLEECILHTTLTRGEMREVSNEQFVRRDGTRFPVEFRTAPMVEEGKLVGAVIVFQDITERKRAEANLALVKDVLEVLNRRGERRSLIAETLRVIRRATGFDAVGLRLREGDDCPYFEHDGFTEEFLREENFLCERGGDGAILRDTEGRVTLECTCGLVLSGRTDPRMSCFTKGGSCWTNQSSEILALPSHADPRTNPRNHCIHTGYQTVGLFPVRVGTEIMGLLQLNDRRPDGFTPALVTFYETMAQHIGFGLQRMMAEEAVRESERRLASVLESMPDAFVSFDRELRYTYVNGNAERLQNAHREDLLGRDVRAVYPDPESYKTISQYERVLAEQVPISATSYHAAFGRWVEIRAFPTPDGVSVFYKDVTDIIKAEQALRESEERLRLLGDNLPDSAVYQYVHECDGSGRFVHISAGIERLNGVSVADVLRDAGTLHRQSPPEYIARLVEAETRSARDLSDFDMELPMRRSDGEVRWMRLHSRPRRLPDGRTIWDGVQADITETRRAEEQIKAALTEKEVLLKEIHHRVKNNMQVISSLVALQAERLPDASMRDVLQDVTDRVRSMALVHEKLYQSSDMARVDFAEYVQSLLGYLWRAHGTAADGVRLSFNLEPVQLSVNAAVPCGLILNELATNALKHAFHGRSDAEVVISLRGVSEGDICLGVCDNGAGLPPGLDWRHSSSLGLRIVQILAGQLRANVEVKSGAGTEFTVTFGKQKA